MAARRFVSLLLFLPVHSLRPAVPTARRRYRCRANHHLSIDLDACLSLDDDLCPELFTTPSTHDYERARRDSTPIDVVACAEIKVSRPLRFGAN